MIAGLVFGLPAGLAAAIAGLAAYMYAMRQEFVDFFFNLTGLLGIWTQQFLDGIKAMLRGVFVDIPTGVGEMLNEKLAFLGRIGSSGPAISPAADAAVGGTSNTSYNSNQAINVQVDARGTTDPSAVGAATQGGVLDAARQMQTQYNNGVQ